MRHLLNLFAVTLLCTGPITADERVDAEKSAIQEAINTYVAGFHQGDAGVLAGLWTEQGELTTPSGEKWVGRQQLQEQFAKYFATVKGAKLELENTEIELQSPSVAVETGLARVIVPDAEPSETTYKAIHVKTSEGWRIDSMREQDVAPTPPSQYEKLKDLEWMIGRWADTSENARIETSCRWTTNQNFIVRTFRVFVDNRVDFEGSDVIGWDPYAQTIRSWMFDSDGGFAAGRWSGGSGRWTVQSLHVLPDGRRASSTNIYEVVNESTVRFRSVGRQVDGELLPNIDPVEFVRIADSQTE